MLKKMMVLGVVFVLALFFGFANCSWAGEKGLVGYWKFDEGEEDIAKDFSGKNNHGKIHGAKWVKGKIGSALQFNGEDDYVNCGNDESLNITDAITIEAWLKTPNPTNNHQTIICGGGYSQILRFYSTTGRIEFYTQNSDGTIKRVMAESVCFPDSWYHVVGTYDKDAGSNNLKLYINGVLEDEETQTLSLKPMSSRWIGHEPGFYFHGTIGEVKIYDRALTAEEIKNHCEKMLLYVVSPIFSNIS